MAATVSRGRPWADRSACERGSVIILSAEDDDADTILPRLIASGADLSRVHVTAGIVAGHTPEGSEVRRGIRLAEDMERLAEIIKRDPDMSLVIIDPISAYLGNVDSHRNAEVRAALTPLSALAAKHRVAVLAICHLSKNDSADPVTRVTGSMAFVAAAACRLAGGQGPPRMTPSGCLFR